jgi:conjugal transfer pilus assembly protein TraF
MESKIPPEEKAIQLNMLWETQRKRAVITGDKEEIKKFLATHYLIINKAGEFAQNYQKIIENDPKLAESESYYKNASIAQIKEEEKETILRNARQRYGLVFIYSSSCQYCVRQLPIIYKFKQEHKLKVMGITQGDEYFPGFDENITDINIANDPLVQALPTILLIDMHSPKKLFVSKGLTTMSDLENKIVNVIKENEAENE